MEWEGWNDLNDFNDLGEIFLIVQLKMQVFIIFKFFYQKIIYFPMNYFISQI